MKRRDLLVFVSAENCNPNGDPDADNMPRQDPETGHGLMTDVSIKSRIKSAVKQLYEEKMAVDEEITPTETRVKEALCSIDEEKLWEMTPLDRDRAVKTEVCARFWDARTFGAVIASLSKKSGTSSQILSDGAITGPVQVSYGVSLAPIVVDKADLISRQNVASEADLKKKMHDFGTKWRVGYAQYAYDVHVHGRAAEWTGFNDEDYDKLLQGILQSWELNRTASKVGMNVDCVIEFTHDNDLGKCSWKKLQNLVSLKESKRFDGRTSYSPVVDESQLPKGVSVKIYD